MRSNLPVTHNEFVVPDGVNPVSTTDLQSHITYCNPPLWGSAGTTVAS
jgi:aerotaxis receptor